MALSNHALLCHHHYGALIHAAGSLRSSNFKRTVQLSHKHRNPIHAFLTDCNASKAEMQGFVQHPALLHTSVPVLEDKLCVCSQAEESRRQTCLLKACWTTGVAMAGWFGGQPVDHASAAQDSVTTAISEAAPKIAPAWLAPSVLAFPVVSYILFTIYRNKVNPYAKLTDWVFGLVAMAILGNLILIATVGVRLY